MYKRLVSVMYALNILFQALFTLIMPAALGFGIAWALVRYLGAPEWVYAPLLVVGVLWGFYSMIKFTISAMAGLERLERQRTEGKKAEKTGKVNEE